MILASVAAAIRPKSAGPSPRSGAPRASTTHFPPLVRILAARSTAPEEGRGRVTSPSGRTRSPAGPHAASAGRINVATWPGARRASLTALATSRPTLSEDVDVLTQPETVRAIPSISDL